jgi:hypothetical protein
MSFIQEDSSDLFIYLSPYDRKTERHTERTTHREKDTQREREREREREKQTDNWIELIYSN